MAFNCSGVSAQGYYHNLTTYGGKTDTRQLFSVWLAPFSDASFRRILHTSFTTGGVVDSHQLLKLSNNKIAIARAAGNTSALSAATNVAITGGKWIHLLAWCASGQTPTLWLNGVKQTGSNTIALGVGANNSRLYVGMRSSQDSPFKGGVAELAYWVTNTTSELPEPSDSDALSIYRSGNPWIYKPSVLRVVRPFQKVDQPAIHLGVGASVKVGTPTQASDHAPITRSNISFIRSVVPAGISISGASVNANYSTPTGTVTLTGTISVTGQVASAVYKAFPGAVDLTGLVDVSGQLVNSDYSVNAGTVILTPTGTIVVVGGVSNADYQVYSGAVTLSGVIDVSGATVNTDYQVYQGTVTLSVVKSTDCFTALEGSIGPILAATGIIDSAETALSGIITPITALEGQIDPSDIALEGKLCC